MPTSTVSLHVPSHCLTEARVEHDGAVGAQEGQFGEVVGQDLEVHHLGVQVAFELHGQVGQVEAAELRGQKRKQIGLRSSNVAEWWKRQHQAAALMTPAGRGVSMRRKPAAKSRTLC